MTDTKHQPTMAWHPQTGENQVFNHPSEVPNGWLDTHPSNKPKSEQPDMTKDEIIAALSAGGVQFDHKAKPKVLAALLRDEVTKALTEAKIEFSADAPTKDLLALLPEPE